jgi:hypothetical protein
MGDYSYAGSRVGGVRGLNSSAIVELMKKGCGRVQAAAKSRLLSRMWNVAVVYLQADISQALIYPTLLSRPHDRPVRVPELTIAEMMIKAGRNSELRKNGVA